MCLVDIIILIIIFALFIHGLITGFVRGIFDLAGIIIGISFAFTYASRLTFPKPIAFILIFIGIVLAASITGRIISKLIHLTPLGIMDRLMGGILGFLKALFFCFVFLIVLFLLNKDSLLNKCEIAPIILKSGISASQLLPENWYKWIKKIVKKQELVQNSYYEYNNFSL